MANRLRLEAEQPGADDVRGERVGIERGVRGGAGSPYANDRERDRRGRPRPSGTIVTPRWWTSWIAGSWSPTARLIAGVGVAASVVAAAARRS
jgi:hypothetical protein